MSSNILFLPCFSEKETLLKQHREMESEVATLSQQLFLLEESGGEKSRLGQVEVLEATIKKLHHEKSDLAHRVAVLERKRQISVETEARLSEAIKGFQAREEVLRQEVLQQHELTQEKNHEQSWETKQLAIVMQNLEALEAKNQMLDPSVECTGSAADLLPGDGRQTHQAQRLLESKLLQALEANRGLQAENARLKSQEETSTVSNSPAFAGPHTNVSLESSPSRARQTLPANPDNWKSPDALKEELRTVHTLVKSLQDSHRQEVSLLSRNEETLVSYTRHL